MNNKKERKLKRQLRIRKKIRGTKEQPRLSVYRSNKFIYAQIIDDEKGETILGVSEKHLDKISKEKKVKKIERARELGSLLAKKAIEEKISKIVFDRGAYSYHGRVKALAEGVREGGLKF